MERNLVAQVREFMKSRKELKRGHRVLTCLAGLVIFVTVYALMMPAVTMSNEVICGMEAHTHDESCYGMRLVSPQPELVCGTEALGGIVIHAHNNFCYDQEGTLICALAERESHTHDESCYQEHRTLLCEEVQEKGHEHDSKCYSYERGELTCELEEGSGRHTHTEACYETRTKEEYTCGQKESAAHTHDESCYITKTNRLLTCTESEGGEAHTHDESCYSVQSNRRLTCGQSESSEEAHSHGESCYTVKSNRRLACGQSEGGHSHSGSCYSTTSREVLTCTQGEYDDVVDEEGNVIQAGHRHGSGCYSTETEQVLTCSQPETEGHTHDAGCYEETEERVLSCGKRESAGGGHTHDASCYEETEERVLTCRKSESAGGGHIHGESCYTITEERVLGCGKSESQGHVHTEECRSTETERALICTESEDGHRHSDECYAWSQTLSCRQEERPAGHVHTDEACYEITQVLACHKQELIPHMHTEGCYEALDTDGDGEPDEEILTCEQKEIGIHDHTSACVYIPEAEPEEKEVLICGMEEHVHEDTCYLETVPVGEKYYCGFSEHLHDELCYTESGALFCTIPEHIHEEICLIPPVETPVGEADSVYLSDTYEHETGEFRLRFHVEGLATVIPETHTDPWNTPELRNEWSDEGAAPLPRDPEEGSIIDVSDEAEEVPLAEEAPAETAPAAPDPIPEPAETPDPAPPPETVIPEPVTPEEIPPSLPDSRPSGGSNDIISLVPPDERPEPEAPVNLLDPQDVRFHVEQVESGRDYQEAMDAASSLSEDQEEPLLLQVLKFSASIDGRELDLSQCSVEVEVSLSPELQAYLDSYAEAQPMTIEGEEAEASGETEFVLMAYQPGEGAGGMNQLGSIAVGGESGEHSMTVAPQTEQDNSGNKLVLALLPKVYPQYSIEFYANLNRPAIGEEPEGASTKLPFIDTSAAGNEADGPVKPKNGGLNAKETGMWINENGSVIFTQELTEIYQAKEKLIFNPLVENTEDQLTVRRLNALRDNPHYEVTGLRVLQPGGDPEDEAAWEVYGQEQLDRLRFTNNPKAAEASEDIVLIQQEGEEHTILRLIYEPTTHTKDYGAVFYDYDVSSGKNSEGKYEVVRQGINSSGNYADNGKPKLGFGNGEGTLGSGLGDEKWGENTLNQTNGNGFNGCTFGLATGIGEGDTLLFNSGIDAPALFGDEAATGKQTIKGHSLRFNQEGDTYTLSSVTGTNATGLEQFRKVTWSKWSKRWIYSNCFWPMDGVTGTDPHFGQTKQYETTGNAHYFPESDDGAVHNHYFGMNFAIEFTLEKEYVGPLEYYFYGDDDMWVFLDNKDLVCDIGGVHSSVGEYVDLWDYIPGGRENHAAGTHTLYFYYTERGASGSTCWMQFTLPNVVHIPVLTPPDEEARPLRVEKHVTGVNAPDPDQEYTFTIQLTGGMTNTFGGLIFDEADPNTPIGQVNDIGCDAPVEFKLKDGQYLEIVGALPPYAGYIIKELNTGLSGEALEFWSPTVEILHEKSRFDKFNGTVATEDSIGNNNVTVIYTNSFNFEMPSTGGNGTLWYTLAGFLPPAAGCCGLWYRKKSKGEEAAD